MPVSCAGYQGGQFIEIVGLGDGVLAHREVVGDQDQCSGVFAHALTDGAVGVAVGEVCERAGSFDEPDVTAAACDLMTECLGDIGYAYSDRAVEDDLFAGVEPAKCARSRSMAPGSLGLAVMSKSSNVASTSTLRDAIAVSGRRIRGGPSRLRKGLSGTRDGRARRHEFGSSGRRGCRSMPDSFRVRSALHNPGSQMDMRFSVKVGLCCVSARFVDSGDDAGVGAELVGPTQKRPGRRRPRRAELAARRVRCRRSGFP